ncbi:sulfatase-like hydrolase/transferase [Neorhizobium galegae]|uniref:sulfatase-like hydrolase/transferase n=1 Tax=Neorhizobium galegae TaxID=399 RepID=UPI001F38CD79|nr:sulfatase-like hydrolase/transferase [Neorhizobium galegae]UIK08810.1 sulfatase-like hydrolase/transferase [Neorhizobium galegae]
MRAIVLMFDSLNRRLLPPYGDRTAHAPNFGRLAEKTATFDRCYAGSMPCMPARREMHTGRYNFLHRSWSPIEPFDDSVPELLRNAGIYTHLVTDHQHYWEDGGATYHTRFSSHEFFRGQEGDLWKGIVEGVDRTRLVDFLYQMKRHDPINRTYLRDERDHPQTRTFDAGLQFIETNAGQDDWMLQLETFDPHEPFFSYAEYHALYPDTGEDFDWPPYDRVTEAEERVLQARHRYLALLSMCDRNLGRLLDMMDEKSMWDDTMLIVCTDHGYMLGERGWWGKSVMPWYDETIHTPFFIWDPRAKVAGERRSALVQTIDIAPTLLDLFGLRPTPDMQGKPLLETVRNDAPVRTAGLFGNFGGHVCVTDGRYVYMRCCAAEDNSPLHEYTLMPTHMRARFSPDELSKAELAQPFSFTKGAPVLRIPGWTIRGPWVFGTLLYDLETDPEQKNPLRDDRIELRMAELLVDLMRASDAPSDQFERLGLPETGPVRDEHLLVERQWAQVVSGQRSVARASDFAQGARVANIPIAKLMADETTRRILLAELPRLADKPLPAPLAAKTLVQAATAWPELDREKLEALERALTEQV